MLDLMGGEYLRVSSAEKRRHGGKDSSNARLTGLYITRKGTDSLGDRSDARGGLADEEGLMREGQMRDSRMLRQLDLAGPARGS